MRKKIFILIWVLFFSVIATVSFAFVGVVKGWIGYMPNIEELQNPINRYASQVFTADGKLLGTWSRSENRIFTDYEHILLLRRMSVSLSIQASTLRHCCVRLLSVVFFNRQVPEVAVQSPSSWRNSSIRKRRVARLSAFCRSPLNG